MMDKTSTLPNIERPPTLKQMAFDAIKNSIVNGNLKTGITYSEKTLAKELGISKSPVREALIDLQLKGFITIIPKIGFKLNELCEKDIRDIYEFRTALEKFVIYKITTDISKKEMNDLKKILARNKANQDILSFMENDIQFHRYLAQLSKNKKIIEALEGIWDLCGWVGYKALSACQELDGVTEEHLNILKAVQKRDKKAVGEAVEKHMSSTLRKIIGVRPC
ncbi:MAG: GntR family transcriptional regulator [Deltaproteobacteria bacterium]|nr:GntR family transcriptional regulator [Deltaproteobacteria bacterium]